MHVFLSDFRSVLPKIKLRFPHIFFSGEHGGCASCVAELSLFFSQEVW